MMSEGSAECDAVRGVLESPIYRDHDLTLHRRRSINLPDEPTVTVTKADSAIHLELSTVCVVDAKKRISSLDSRINDSMIADALTKRRGNSVTMLKFVKTGQLSIVVEDKELAEVISGSPWSQSTSTARGQKQRTCGLGTTIRCWLCKDNTACLRTRSQLVDVAFPEPVLRT